MIKVNEGTTAYVTFTFRDKSGAPEAPEAIQYWIDDVSSGRRVRESTAIDTGSSVEVKLTTTDTQILNTSSVSEERRITVRGTYGEADAVVGEAFYEVVNLAGV